MYLSYEEYKDMGGSMSEAAFNSLEYKARKRIDCATQNRLIEDGPVRESVKRLMYELINGYQANAGQQGISSASNDGVAVTYVTGAEAAARETAIIKQYLTGELTKDGTPVLYLGVV